MPGVKKHDHIRVNCAALELLQRAEEYAPVRLLNLNDLEIHALQGRRHIRRVIGRIGQPRDLLVLGIADHQRHALVGKSVAGQENA